MSYSFDGANSTTVRPAHKTAATAPNWAKDESSPGLNDGTKLTASWANRIVAVLRAIHTEFDIAYNENDDTILAQAIRAATEDVIAAGGYALDADLTALENEVHGLGDVQVVADLTEAAALTDLDAGDLVHVLDNGSGKWVRYQITTPGDGTWGDASKVVLWTQDQAPTSHTHPAADISDSTAAGRSVLTAATIAAITALLDDMVGDSGSGGTKGLVPAPAAGDAAAGKFLKADGTYAVPAAAGGGEANTASNVGTAGVGVFKQKSGLDLQFKKLNVGSGGGLTVTDDTGNDEIDLAIATSGVVEAKIADEAVTNAKLADIATARFKGRTTAGTGPVEDLTATQATALLDAMVGDSGAGGTKGLVPAPAAGDAAAGKFLRADGTFAAPSGSGSPTGTIAPYAGRTAPSGWLLCSGAAVSRATYADLFAVLCPSLGDFTVTIANPGVFTLNGHGLSNGDRVRLSTTGALPTGLNTSTDYFVVSAATNTFQLSASQGGSAINTSGSQSGTHTAQFFGWGSGDGTTTFNLPDMRGRVPAGIDTLGGTAASRITSGGSGIHGGALGAGAGGSETHTLITAELAAHTHTTPGNDGTNNSASGAQSVQSNSNGTTGSAGSGNAHNNTQPTVMVAYIIKT